MRLRSVGWVIVASWHKRLRLVSGLERLEGGRVNGTLGNVGQRRTRRHVTGVRRLASMLIEAAWLLARSSSSSSRSAVNVSGDLLMERLLFLLLRRVEVHRSRRLYACDVDVLLRARLVHGQLTLRPVLAEGRFLGRGV